MKSNGELDLLKVLPLGGLSPQETFQIIAQIGLPKGQKKRKTKKIVCANCKQKPTTLGIFLRDMERTIKLLEIPEKYHNLWFCSYTCVDEFLDNSIRGGKWKEQ